MMSDVRRDVVSYSRQCGMGAFGASTLPEEVFNRFPENDAVEIHLATGFQNMILDAETLPAEMKQEIREFCFANCADERKEGETDEQFVYKTRKKAIGPFKQRMWELPESEKKPIIDAIEKKYLAIPWVNTIAADSKGKAYYADIGAIPNVSDAKASECNSGLGVATTSLIVWPSIIFGNT